MKKYVSHIALFLFAIVGVVLLSGCSLTSEVSVDTPPEQPEQEEQQDAPTPEMPEENIEMENEEDTAEQNEETTDEQADASDEETEQEETTEEENTAENRFADNEEEVVVSLDKQFRLASGSSVSYTAAKKWLNKPAESVVGTNTTVNGGFTYNGGKITGLAVSVDSQTFASGSGGRDNHVRGMLNGPITISADNLSDLGPGSFSKTLPLSVTINGKTNTVNFSVSGNVSENQISAEGNGTISLEAFNVEAPSILNLYTVDDNLGVSFKVTAK